MGLLVVIVVVLAIFMPLVAIIDRIEGPRKRRFYH